LSIRPHMAILSQWLILPLHKVIYPTRWPIFTAFNEQLAILQWTNFYSVVPNPSGLIS
jgi:hypothetical protein